MLFFCFLPRWEPVPAQLFVCVISGPDVDSAQPMSAVAGVSSDWQRETEADPDVDRNPGHRRRPVSWRMFPGYLPNHSREEYV